LDPNGGFSFDYLVKKLSIWKEKKRGLFEIENIIDNLVQKRKNK
jgi:hypothetical protein